MKSYIIRAEKISGFVDLDDKNIIINTNPLFGKFVRQPLTNLTGWLLEMFKGYSLERFKE